MILLESITLLMLGGFMLLSSATGLVFTKEFTGTFDWIMMLPISLGVFMILLAIAGIHSIS